MTPNTLRAIAVMVLGGALLAPATVRAQESKCSPCEAEERDRAVRRYQQEIERVRREIVALERQLASTESMLDSGSVRRLNQKMQRAITQLSRAHVRQAAYLQSLGERTRTSVVTTARPANQWTTQPIDGYLGVLWSANVHIEKPKHGEALWTFHDYPHVEAVERESPAERAGIQVGDMILAFDGKDLRAGKIPMNALLRPGSTVTVRLTRENRTRSVSVKVEERPRTYARVRSPRASVAVEAPSGEWVVEVPALGDVPPPPPTASTPRPPQRATILAPSALGAPGTFGLLGAATVGAEMIPLDETLGEPYGVDHGLLILSVGPRTPAARAGILKGDVLLSADGRELHSVSALIRAVDAAEKEQLRIELLRKGERKVVVMTW